MNLRRKLLKFLAVSPLLANNTASAQTPADSQPNDQTVNLSWGHININVSDLDASIEFYEKLGFEHWSWPKTSEKQYFRTPSNHFRYFIVYPFLFSPFKLPPPQGLFFVVGLRAKSEKFLDAAT